MSSPVVLLGHTHSHTSAKQHSTLTHITRRGQCVGSLKSVEAQGLDSNPLLTPEGLGMIRFLYADASLTDTGANPPPETHVCASRVALPGRGQRRGAGPRLGLSHVARAAETAVPAASGPGPACLQQAGKPSAWVLRHRGPGGGELGVVAGSCLSRMMAAIAQPPPTLQHEAGKEEAHCHGHTQ